MMIGPDPMTSTDLRSSRLGMPSLHQLAELSEQAGRVVRSGRGLRVVLDAESRRVQQPQALDHAVVEVDVGDLGWPEVGVEDSAGLPGPGGQRDGEAMIVAGDLHPAGAQVLHRLVHPAVAETKLVGAEAERPAAHLAAQADA